MPPDRPNRTRAADALAAYLRGEIDNFKFADETLSLDTKDKTLREMCGWLWHCYDDIKRHTVHATPAKAGTSSAAASPSSAPTSN